MNIFGYTPVICLVMNFSEYHCLTTCTGSINNLVSVYSSNFLLLLAIIQHRVGRFTLYKCVIHLCSPYYVVHNAHTHTHTSLTHNTFHSLTIYSSTEGDSVIDRKEN